METAFHILELIYFGGHFAIWTSKVCCCKRHEKGSRTACSETVLFVNEAHSIERITLATPIAANNVLSARPTVLKCDIYH